MEYTEALQLAETVKAQLAPFCERIEIAGSIRRKKATGIKDIEIVAIPLPYETGLFQDGIAPIVNAWQKVKGELPCKYTQRILPINLKCAKLDLFFAELGNWGMIYAIRTGSAEYSHKILASGWVAKGYKSIEGYLHYKGQRVIVKEEQDLFKLIGINYVEPEFRNL